MAKTVDELFKELQEKYSGGIPTYKAPTVPEPILPELETKPKPFGIPERSPTTGAVPPTPQVQHEPIDIASMFKVRQPTEPVQPEPSRVSTQPLPPVQRITPTEQREEMGMVGEAITGVPGGLVDLALLKLQALRLGRRPEDTPRLTAWEKKLQSLREEKELFQPTPTEAPMSKQIPHHGVRSFVTSLGAGLPALVLGQIAARIAGGPAAWLGTIIQAGYSMGAASIFAAAEYDRFMQEGRKQGLSDDTIKPYAITSAIVEGGAEFVANLLAMRIFKVGIPGAPGKEAVKTPVRTLIKQVLAPGFKEYGKGVLKQWPVEVSTELFQEFMEDNLRKAAGIPSEYGFKEGVLTAGSTMVMTTLFGAGARIYNKSMVKGLQQALSNAEADPKNRIAAVNLVYEGLNAQADKIKRKDKEASQQLREMATLWKSIGLAAVEKKLGIDVNLDVNNLIYTTADKIVNGEVVDKETQGDITEKDELSQKVIKKGMTREEIAEFIRSTLKDDKEGTTQEAPGATQEVQTIVVEKKKPAPEGEPQVSPKPSPAPEGAVITEKPVTKRQEEGKRETTHEADDKHVRDLAIHWYDKWMKMDDKGRRDFIGYISSQEKTEPKEGEPGISESAKSSIKIFKEMTKIPEPTPMVLSEVLSNIKGKTGGATLELNASLRKIENLMTDQKRYIAGVSSIDFPLKMLDKDPSIITKARAFLMARNKDLIKLLGEQNISISVLRSDKGDSFSVNLNYMTRDKNEAKYVAGLSRRQAIFSEFDYSTEPALSKKGETFDGTNTRTPTVKEMKELLEWYRSRPMGPINIQSTPNLTAPVARGILLSLLNNFAGFGFDQEGKTFTIYNNMDEYRRAHPELQLPPGTAIAGRALVIPWDLKQSKLEFVLTGFRDAFHIQRVVWEEINHIGVFAFFRDRIEPWMLKLYDQLGAESFTEIAKVYGLDLADKRDQFKAALEKVGQWAYDRSNPPPYIAFRGMLKSWIRSALPTLNISNAEIDYSIMRSIQIMRGEWYLTRNLPPSEDDIAYAVDRLEAPAQKVRTRETSQAAESEQTMFHAIDPELADRNYYEWEHYRSRKGLTELHPKYSREGIADEERNIRLAYPDLWVDRIYLYRKGAKIEPRFQQYTKYEGRFYGSILRMDDPIRPELQQRAQDLLHELGYSTQDEAALNEAFLSEAKKAGYELVETPDGNAVCLVPIKLTPVEDIKETGTYQGKRYTSSFGVGDVQYVARNKKGEDIGRIWINVRDNGWFLHKVEVDKRYRRKGIATALYMKAYNEHGALVGVTALEPDGRALIKNILEKYPETIFDIDPELLKEPPEMSAHTLYHVVTAPSYESEGVNLGHYVGWIKANLNALSERKQHFDAPLVRDTNDLEATYILPFWMAMKFRESMGVFKVQADRLDRNNVDLINMLKDPDNPDKNFPLLEMVTAGKDVSKVEKMIVWSDANNVYPQTDAELNAIALQQFNFVLNNEEIQAYRSWKKGMDKAVEWAIERLTAFAYKTYEKEPIWGKHLRDIMEGRIHIQDLDPTGLGIPQESLKRLARAMQNIEERLAKIEERKKQLQGLNFYMMRQRGKGDYVIRAHYVDNEAATKIQDAINGGMPELQALKKYGKEVFYDRRATLHEAEALRRELNEKHPDLVISKAKEPALTESIYQAVDPDALLVFARAAIERAQKRQVMDEKAANELLDAFTFGMQEQIYARAGQQVMIGRYRERVIAGYKETELHKVYSDYMSALVGSINKMEAAYEFHEALKAIDGNNQPKLFQYWSTYVHHMLRNPSEMDKKFNSFKTLPYAWFLALNFRMMAAQFCQNFMTSIPVLNRYIKQWGVEGGGGTARIMKAMMDIARGNLTQEERDMINRAYLSGEINANQINEMRGRIHGSWVKDKFNKVLDIVSLPFSGMEKFNRLTSHLVMYRLARQAGKDQAEAYEHAREFTWATHFAYGITNMPQALREDVLLSKVGGLLWVFRSFSHNYLLSMKHYLRTEEGRIAFDVIGRSTAFLVMMGGLGALPFLDDFLDKLEQMTGNAYRKYMRDAIKKYGGTMLASIGMEGIPALIGIDIGGTMKVGIPFVGELSDTVYGVWGGLADKGMKGIDGVLKGDYFKAAESFSPVGVESVFKAIRQAKEGLRTTYGVPVLDEENRPVVLTPTEQGFQAFSFRPSRISAIQKELRSLQNIEQYFRKRRTDINKAWRIAQTPDERAKVLSDIQKYNEDIKQYKGALTPIDVSSLRTAMRPKPKLSKYATLGD